MPGKPSEDDRKKFKFDPKNFLNKIVTPWYRLNGQISYYSVAEVNKYKF